MNASENRQAGTARTKRFAARKTAGKGNGVHDHFTPKSTKEALLLSTRLPAENPAPVLRVSREKIVHFANPAAQNILSGWNARVGEPAPAAILELIEGGHRWDKEINVGVRWYAVAVVPVPDGDFINLYFTDISERKGIEEKLRESETRLQMELADSKLLQALSAEIVFEPRMEALYEQLVQAAVAIMRSDFASMQMFCPERRNGELRLLAHRNFEPEAAKAWEWVTRETPTTCGEALRTKSRVIASDLERCDFLGEEGVAAYLAAGIYSVQSTPLLSRGGRLVGMISTHWRRPHQPTERELRLFDILARQAADVIEQRRAREVLEQTVAERTASLREALAQMEEFSYSVSHDLRAPLRAMGAYAGVLLEEYGEKLDDTGRGYLEKIQRSSERMDRLTQDVLTYSRIARSQVRLEPIALEILVKDVIHQYSYLQPPAAHIELASPLLEVLGNETTFGQCIANLLNNAVKFVPRGTTPRVCIRTERFGKNVRVWFEDNGIGIKPGHQVRIFQMFERVHPEGKYEGTGIGLTIVRKAVEKMGGKVGVESDGQNGCRFWIELRSPDKLR